MWHFLQKKNLQYKMPYFYSTFRYCCRRYTVEILLFSDLAKNAHLKPEKKNLHKLVHRAKKTHFIFKHPVVHLL